MITTPWGSMEVADAHVHFFSPEFFRVQAEQKGVKEIGSLLGWDVPQSSEELADRWAAEMDRQGVESALLVASVPGDVESVETAVDRHPERFRSVVMINPIPPGADLGCERALADGFVKGIFLFPGMHRYSLHESRVHSVLSIAAGYPGTIVYIHFGMLSVAFRKKLGLASPFDMRFSNPIDLHATALAFPKLRFVIPHFGAGYFREALMVADLCPNVYFDTSSSNKWMRCEPAVTDLASVFRRALDVLGPKRLLFGSDSSWFPRGWVRGVFDEQVAAMLAAGVDVETARGILGGNLLTLFRE
jgi:uncharacterized protein